MMLHCPAQSWAADEQGRQLHKLRHALKWKICSPCLNFLVLHSQQQSHFAEHTEFSCCPHSLFFRDPTFPIYIYVGLYSSLGETSYHTVPISHCYNVILLLCSGKHCSKHYRRNFGNILVSLQNPSPPRMEHC